MTNRATRGRVAIVMGLFNGAAHLRDQLDSFTAQSVTDWDLIVSDDGSGDDGPKMIREFARGQKARQRRVTLVDGPRQGVAVNFLSLLAALPDDAAWVALSDQDDVWLPERLATGQQALSEVPRDVPAVFGSATWIVDADLGNRRMSPRLSRQPDFRNALVQSIAGGNTMLLNRAGAALAREAAREALAQGGPATHDWWLYQLISGAGGQVIRSEQPTVLYRQHGGNLFGTNRGLRASVQRVSQVLNGDLATWIALNTRTLQASAHRLTPENRAVLDRFATLGTQDVVARLRGFRQLGLYRQGRAGQAVLWLAAALGRL